MITLSFIIPALNEELNIGDTIDRITEATGSICPREIIVVDNGSTDHTVTIAEKKSAIVLKTPGKTIAEARNIGASHAQGDIFVFLDADVLLTPTWRDGITQVITDLLNNPMIVTGSVCGIAHNASWLERNWFDPSLRKRTSAYINSGHLIVNGQLFAQVGGFNHLLETGEDVDFCIRAIALGARVVPNPLLRVIHTGYPKRVGDFIRRERWHGRGDYTSLRNIISSKPAAISLFLLLCLISMSATAVLSANYWWLVVFLLIAISISLMSSVYRFGFDRKAFVPGSLIYGIYFGARALSFLDIMRETILKWTKKSRGTGE